jgi:SnoaL-like domain
MSAPASNIVAWFEIGAPDVDAAKAFYGHLFSWSFAPDGAYTLITAPGAAGPSGGIFNTGGHIPPYAVFVVQVADVAATAARTEALAKGNPTVASRCASSARPGPGCTRTFAGTIPSRKETVMTDTTSPALRTALASYQAWTSHDLDKAMS